MFNHLTKLEMKKLLAAKKFYESVVNQCSEALANASDELTKVQVRFNLVRYQSKLDTIELVLTRNS